MIVFILWALISLISCCGVFLSEHFKLAYGIGLLPLLILGLGFGNYGSSLIIWALIAIVAIWIRVKDGTITIPEKT